MPADPMIELDQWLLGETNVSRRVLEALERASLQPLWRATNLASRILYKSCAQEAPGGTCSHTADQHVLMFLGCRALTNTLGALRLLRAGYYRPALTLDRDVLETALLLQFFSESPDEIAMWREANSRDRSQRFRPGKIGRKLDARGTWNRYRDEYGEYSELAGHPTPTSRILDWRTDLGRPTVGPFFEQATIIRVLSRIAINVCDVCYHLLGALNLRDAFADDWRRIEEFIDMWHSSGDECHDR